MSETEVSLENENSGDEPTMEEILSSIRRIISDDEKDEDEGEMDMAAAMEEDDGEMDMAAIMAEDEDDDEILELTEVLSEDDDLISVDDIDDLEFSQPTETENVKIDDLPVVSVSESLISDKVGEQVNQNFHLLTNTLLSQNGAGQTVEAMVMALMRPMLKGWLDDNLPIMVEKIIREEIERVARGGKT